MILLLFFHTPVTGKNLVSCLELVFEPLVYVYAIKYVQTKPAAKTAEMPNTMSGIILDFCATTLFELLK